MTTTREWRDDPPAETGHWGAGAQLRATREAFGLSLEEVAQQLKLAPRQVIALEDEDFAQLPGRTFVRGFVRNYAPALQSTGSLKAELPSASASKSSFARWMIPVVLVACIVAAASYEWRRSAPSSGEEAAPVGSANQESRNDDKAAPTQGTPLPNPLANARAPESAQQGRVEKADAASTPPAISAEPAAPASSASPSAAAPAPAMPATGISAQTAPASVTPAPGPAAARPAANAPTSPAASTPPVAEAKPTAPAPTATVLINYSGPSWTEVRDRNGQVLIARLVPGDSMQAIEGAPPFAIMIGNARAVSLAYRGKSVDLSHYTKNNVARLTLK